MTRRTRPTLGVLAAALAAAVLLPGSSALAPPAVFAAARVALVARVAPSAPTVAGFSIRVDGDSAVHLGPLASAPPAEPVRRPIDPSPAGGSDSGAWPLVVLAAIVVGSLGGVALTRRLEGRHARRSLARSDRYLDRGGTPDGEAWVSRALARRP